MRQQLNPTGVRIQRRLSIEEEAELVINTRGTVYNKGDFTLYRISCQCNSFKQEAMKSNNTPNQQPYQQACIITAGLLRDTNFLNSKITEQNSINRYQTSKALSLLANTFSHWNRSAACRETVMYIAQYITQPNYLLSRSNAQVLSNLANAFSKWSAPEDVDFKSACQAIAQQLLKKRSLAAFNPQHLANLANAFSKWSASGDKEFKSACQAIAKHLLDNTRSLAAFNPQDLANLANAFSKWSVFGDKEFKSACQAIAQQLLKNTRLLPEFNHQELANLANAFSKWSAPEDVDFKSACQAIAQQLLDNRSLSKFTPQHLSNLVNAFSKWSASGDKEFKTVCQAIAQQLLVNKSLADFNSQGLSNLANAFSKWSASGDKEFKSACQAIAQQLLDNKSLADFNSQGLANLANAFSKWSAPEDVEFKSACQVIAQQLLKNTRLLPEFNHQELANLANAFSKWLAPDEVDFKSACQAIAQQLLKKRSLAAFNPQDLANLANAFSKWSAFGDKEFKSACQAIAQQLLKKRSLAAFNPQDLANLANAFSKWSAPDEVEFKSACQAIAQQLLKNTRLLPEFNHQELANLANAFSKWSAPEDVEFKSACQAIAQQLLKKRSLAAFNPQDLANLANAFSKWSAPDEVDFKSACQAIAQQLLDNNRSLAAFNPQHLSNLANAFSKWSAPEVVEFKSACQAIAQQLLDNNRSLAAFNSQGLANLANAFSKWSAPEVVEFKSACQAIAQQLLDNKSLADFNSQHLSNLANAFSKWSAAEDKVFKTVCQAIAQQLLKKRSLAAFNPQDLANLANAFSKWSAPDDVDFKSACQAIAQQLLDNTRSLAAFNPQHLANLANAFSKWSAPEKDIEESFNGALHAIANHLINTPTEIEQSTVLTISMLLKAYRQQAGWLHHGLAPILIQQLEKQIAAENNTALPFKVENLETLGNLAMGLYPFLGQPGLVDLKHRVLTVLLNLQPAIARKAHYCLMTISDGAVQEAYQSRCPALSFYQLLTVYHQVAQELSASKTATPHTHSRYADRDRKITELNTWLVELLDNHGHVIVDWSSYSWNKIAELEAEYIENATDQLLDQFVQKHLATLPPARFNGDWRQIFERLTVSPQPPAGTSGKLILHQYDTVGKYSVTDPVRTIEYCLLGRLANGTLPLLEVRLPGYPSRHLIERLVYRNGIAFRMDLLGGNRMKQKSLTVDERLQQQSMENYGSLVALPLHETVSGGPLSKLLQQLFPYQESFFYAQRALLAQPIAGVQSVLEGCFKLMIFPDQIADTPAPFQFKNDLQLRAHDGCGFIKQSLARRMAAVRAKLESWVFIQGGDHQADSYLPAQALQHYPAADAALLQEIRTQLAPLLTTVRQSNSPDDLATRRALFFALTSGGIHGKSLVALPAADGNVHWRSTESTCAEPALLIGRAPYNKANLRSIASHQLMSGGTTAQFLQQNNPILQYSLVATSSTDQAAESLWFAKGLSVVIPDEIWPEAYQGCDMVLSAEDIKTDSHWRTAKIRPTIATPLRAQGVLVVVDIFPSHDAIAVPPNVQRALSGDFDGDRVLVITGQPCLYQHIEKHMQQAPPGWATKPLKTFTPAVNSAGCYQWGRLRQISSVVISKVLQCFTTLQRTWLAITKDRQQAVAELVIADNEIMQRVKNLCPELPELDSIGRDGQIELVSNMLIQGINAGTDAFKADTAIVQFDALAKSLQSLFSRKKLPCLIPYSKKNLAEKIAHDRLDPDAIREALQDNPNLAASTLCQGLAMWRSQQDAYPIANEWDPASRVAGLVTGSVALSSKDRAGL